MHGGSILKVLCAAGIATAIPLLAYVASTLNGQTSAVSTSLALALGIFSYNVVAVPFFLVGVRGYKDEFRRVYILFSVAAVLYGIAQLQFPLIVIFHLEFLATYGVVVLPFIISVNLFFVALRRFAQLLQIRRFWLSPFVVYAVALAFATSAVFVPHISTPGLNYVAIITTNAINFFITVIVFFAAAAASVTRAAAAERYRQSLSWCLASLSLFFVAALHYAVAALIVPLNHWYFAYGIPLLPSLFGTVSLLLTGYYFTIVNEPAAIKGWKKSSPIDVLTYMATFASNPHEIDIILDPVRAITVEQTNLDNHRLTQQQEEELKKVYLQLENYLIHREALQKYSQQGLRGMVRNRFQPTADSVFWAIFENPVQTKK